jgi:hypothetical protein
MYKYCIISYKISYMFHQLFILKFTFLSFDYSFMFLSFPTWNIGPLSGFLLSHIQRYMVRLLWTSDQPVAETSTYTGQHNI